MEMPFDVLNKRLGKIRDNGDIDFDNTAAALDIDEELQRKFVSIPYEEIAAVEIEDTSRTNVHTSLQAGSGPETIRANPDDNPAWLYNSAIHALAMWQHLSRLQERKAEQEKLDKRPECGVYQGYDDDEYFTVIVTSRRRVLVQQATGGLSDMTELWDAKASDTPCPWALQRIDITDGTITK